MKKLLILLLIPLVPIGQDRYYEDTANVTYIDAHQVIFQESKYQKPDTVLHLGKLDASVFDTENFDVLIIKLPMDDEGRTVKYIKETYKNQ